MDTSAASPGGPAARVPDSGRPWSIQTNGTIGSAGEELGRLA